jgi:TldD protein
MRPDFCRETSGFEESADFCIGLAQKLGVEYVDVRVERCYDERFLTKNNAVQLNSISERMGIGIRIMNNRWGFSATTDFSKASLKEHVARAVKGSRIRGDNKGKIKLSPVKAYEASYRTTGKRVIEKIPVEEKFRDFEHWESLLRISAEIETTEVRYSGIDSRKLFTSSDGSNIWSGKEMCWADLQVSAKTSTGLKSFTRRLGGSKGYDSLTEEIEREASGIGREATMLRKAPEASDERETTVILSPSFAGLLCHEVCGHPSEADRILGRERVRAGTSWWANNLGEKLGSDVVTAIDDPTLDGTLGYGLYDDEGVKTRPKMLVSRGYISEFLNSRETAAIFNLEPNGSMRALGFDYIPLVRMSNTFFKQGDWSKAEIIRDTKRGYLLGPAACPSICSRRFAWTISSPYAYLIRNGEIMKSVRDIAVFSTAPRFLKSVDAVSKDWALFPLSACGKGEPKQPMPCSLGGPYMRGKASVMKID